PEKYLEALKGKRAQRFYAMLSNVDDNMGRVDAFLKESGLRDNTIVVFMTDNGGTAGVPIYNAGLRGHKQEYYDGGHRVPCFVRWPAGGLRTGDIAVPAQVQDLFPTFVDYCGVAQAPKTDGLSLAGLLKNGTPLPDRMFVVQIGATPTVPTDPA